MQNMMINNQDIIDAHTEASAKKVVLKLKEIGLYDNLDETIATIGDKNYKLALQMFLMFSLLTRTQAQNDKAMLHIVLMMPPIKQAKFCLKYKI